MTSPAEEGDPPPPRDCGVGVPTPDLLHRPLVAADAGGLRRLFGRLSERSLYNRFFAVIREIPEGALEALADNDGHDRVAIAVVEKGEIVAVARYALTGEGTAEVAILVDDEHQGHHLGPDLLAEIARSAREAGLTHFRATVLAENSTALRVFRRVFPHLSSRFDSGTYELDIPLRLIPPPDPPA